MSPSVRISLFVAMSAALTLPLSSVAREQQCTHQSKQLRRRRPNAMVPSMNGPITGFPDQTTARAAHPITQGGTTGGTVNPGINSDGQEHGYNGG